MHDQHSSRLPTRGRHGADVARFGDPSEPCVTLPARAFARQFVAYLALGGDPAELGPELAALALRVLRGRP